MTAVVRKGGPRAVGAVGVVVLAVAAFGLVATRGDGGPGRPAGSLAKAPAFSLPGVGGMGTVSLADFEGRPVVLNFFAAWCVPCRTELPALAEAERRSGGRVAFVGIDHQDSRTNAVEMLEEAGVNYPAGYDPRGSVAPTYGLRGLPATVFITADGRIQETHRGALDLASLEQRMQRLIDAVPALQRRGS